MFYWRLVPAIAGGLLMVGLGVQTYEPLAPDTLVVRALTISSNSSAFWHFATLDCISHGNALDGYVENVFDLVDDPPVLRLTPDAEAMTLSRARRIVHDRPSTHAFDPRCVWNGEFEPKKSRLLWDIIGWR